MFQQQLNKSPMIFKFPDGTKDFLTTVKKIIDNKPAYYSRNFICLKEVFAQNCALQLVAKQYKFLQHHDIVSKLSDALQSKGALTGIRQDLSEAVFDNQNSIRWLPCEMKDYVRVQMKVIFIRAKSTVEENCYLEMYVGWSGKVVDESKPV